MNATAPGATAIGSFGPSRATASVLAAEASTAVAATGLTGVHVGAGEAHLPATALTRSARAQATAVGTLIAIALIGFASAAAILLVATVFDSGVSA